MFRYIPGALLLLTITPFLSAQLSPLAYLQPGTSIEQSFNGLPLSGSFGLAGKGPHPLAQLTATTTGLQGWYILQIAGNQLNSNFSTSTGSATASGSYSYGLNNNPNRALGTMATGTGVYAFGIMLKNETGIILNRIKIRLLATQWRKGGSGNKNTWHFGFLQGDTAKLLTDTTIKDSRFDLVSIHSGTGTATLNGHLQVNQLWIEDSITNIYWLPGQELVLQWSDFDETGSDDGMAIDDFSFKAFQQASLPVISNVYSDSIHTNNAIVSALINDQLSNTSVDVQIDTAINLLTATTIPDIIPGTITGGSGNVKVSTTLKHLSPAKKYYYRFAARNQQGISYSPVHLFITKAALPVVQTDSLVQLDHNSCIAFGSVLSDGGDAIQEKGISWGTDSLPAINQNSILTAGNDTGFYGSIYQLASGTKFFFRAYCKNAAGIAYGNALSWFTPTSVISFKRNGHTITNKDTIIYEIQFKDKITGITADHFLLIKDRDSDASIIQVKEGNLSWQLQISTGNKDGNIKPVFLHHESYQPKVLNTPYTANTTMTDKTVPRIRSVQLNNRSYKSGDTIPVTINTDPEKNLLKLVTGNVSGYPLQQLSKETDSSWKAFCIIKNGGKEITAEDDITVTILLSDEAGNQNNQSSFKIIQNNDAIDLSGPVIDRMFITEKSILKSGDSLLLHIQFSENIILDSSNGNPVLSVTIGTRIRNPFLYRATSKTVLTFCYIIQPDELDMDGIRVANIITLNNAIIRDIAGNLLNNNIPNAGIFSNVRVDAVVPVITSVTTPIAKTYGISDSLYFHVFVSEPLIISTRDQLPYLEITVGNTVHKTIYVEGSNNPLRFYWIVSKGESDKNGLTISTLLMNTKGITDSSGNNIEPVLRSIGSLSHVWIDAVTPAFKDSIAVLQVCLNKSIQLNDVLKADDTEQGEILSWTTVSAPLNGNIRGLPFSGRWTSGAQLPESVFYVPGLIEAGFDECIIRVSDGVNTAQKKIKIQINRPISNNLITSDQMVCAGFSAQPLQGAALKGGNGIYQFIWESSSNGNSYQKAPGVYDKETYHPLNMHSSSVFRRIVSSGACIDTSHEVFINVRSTGLWLGHQSNNWHTGGNWCGGAVPDKQTDVYINENKGGKLIEVTDSAFCKSVSVHSSQLLRITAPLLFTGLLSGSNNIDVSNGTIISGGKEKQFLQGSVFTNKSVARLIVSGPELELTDTLIIRDYFSIQKGIFNSKDRLLLDKKASNYPNAPGTILKGQLFTCRDIIGRQRALLMHHPYKNSLPIHISSDSNILKGGDMAFFISGFASTDSIYMINNTLAVSKQTPSFNWQSFTINDNKVWQKSKGVVLSKPGFSSLDKEPVSLLLKGQAITGDAEIAFPSSPHNNYLLTGNPYLSAINSKHITKSEGIGNYYWVWDTSLATYGAYRAKSFSANNTIQIFEGFIIKTIADKPLLLSYPEQSKQTNTISDSLEALIENTYQLEIELIKDNTVHDKLLILDVDSASTRYDATDAEKIMNPESSLYTLSTDTIPLAVDARWMTRRTCIPLGIDTKTGGEFMLKFSRVWLKPGLELELQDMYKGNRLKIDTNKSYSFNTTKDAESFGRNRFIIRSPQVPQPPEEVLQLQVHPVPAIHMLTIVFEAKEKANTSILIKNIHGQLLLSRAMGLQQKFTQQVPVGGFLKGHYIVEVHAGKYVIAKTFIKL